MGALFPDIRPTICQNPPPHRMRLVNFWACFLVHGKSYTTQLTPELPFVSNSKAEVQKHAT